MKILKSFTSMLKSYFSYILVFSIAMTLIFSLALNNSRNTSKIHENGQCPTQPPIQINKQIKNIPKQYTFYPILGKKDYIVTSSIPDICIWIFDKNDIFVRSNKFSKNDSYNLLIYSSRQLKSFNLKIIPDTSVVSQVQNSNTKKQHFQSSDISEINSITPKHFPYSEALENYLVMISSYAQEPYQRFEFLDREAGKSLMKMIYSARDEGIWIVPVSGFRTIKKQEKLFNNQVKRYGSPEAAAKVSAPPGYSEHHTGYAIDLADGNFPKQDITQEFVNTKAYKWLTNHAKEFGFELSFPPNNSQGINFEPWHWRFIGSKQAKETFSHL